MVEMVQLVRVTLLSVLHTMLAILIGSHRSKPLNFLFDLTVCLLSSRNQSLNSLTTEYRLLWSKLEDARKIPVGEVPNPCLSNVNH